MIEVTRLDDSKVWINADLVKFVKGSPDTIITLSTGERIIVKEEVKDVCKKIVEYYRAIYRGTGGIMAFAYGE